MVEFLSAYLRKVSSEDLATPGIEFVNRFCVVKVDEFWITLLNSVSANSIVGVLRISSCGAVFDEQL